MKSVTQNGFPIIPKKQNQWNLQGCVAAAAAPQVIAGGGLFFRPFCTGLLAGTR